MTENILNIEKIKTLVLERKIKWTNHCLNRMTQRNISILDIKTAINKGSIIEYYNDDYPYPNCLIMGYNINNRLIHIVCSVNNDFVYMITAYYPDADKWKDDLKTRR